jgi:hypothetical protein
LPTPSAVFIWTIFIHWEISISIETNTCLKRQMFYIKIPNSSDKAWVIFYLLLWPLIVKLDTIKENSYWTCQEVLLSSLVFHINVDKN